MYWLYLGAAIALEIAGTISMKFSQGFTRLTPSILMVVFYLLAFTALNFSLKQIDVSVAYAIWSGLGTAVIAVIGYLYFNESMSLLKAGSIVLIILGVIGLNLGGGAHGSSAGAPSESAPASKQQAQD
ncbi:DMT family transporter [Paenibacillus tyrfis]|uniref:DMT family transporter n=1 Tax=Paenibacillus tyrfis TaxID=1501230 RepID=UPI0020A11584|nr:multidrug efflux SMR transporter [Paenibacillus tyrfis]MCP1311288.1 multidrug efflux SMR transporter [Paenibacillus tyrfis]